jgi:hypothetical protein
MRAAYFADNNATIAANPEKALVVEPRKMARSLELQPSTGLPFRASRWHD